MAVFERLLLVPQGYYVNCCSWFTATCTAATGGAACILTCILVVELPVAPLGPLRKCLPLIVLYISILTPISHPPLCGRNQARSAVQLLLVRLVLVQLLLQVQVLLIWLQIRLLQACLCFRYD
jgi:hypothetical protein